MRARSANSTRRSGRYLEAVDAELEVARELAAGDLELNVEARCRIRGHALLAHAAGVRVAPGRVYRVGKRRRLGDAGRDRRDLLVGRDLVRGVGLLREVDADRIAAAGAADHRREGSCGATEGALHARTGVGVAARVQL